MISAMRQYENVPNYRCRDCAYCYTEHCKRFDYRKVMPYKKWFDCAPWEWCLPCADFKPSGIHVDGLKRWHGFDAWYQAWLEQWRNGEPPRDVLVHINGDYHTAYKIPWNLYLRGEHIKDGILQATEKMWYTRQWHYETINGARLDEPGEFIFHPRKCFEHERKQPEDKSTY